MGATYLPLTAGLTDNIRSYIPAGYPSIPTEIQLPLWKHGVTTGAEMAIYEWTLAAIPFGEISNFFGTDNQTIRLAIKHHYDGTHERERKRGRPMDQPVSSPAPLTAVPAETPAPEPPSAGSDLVIVTRPPAAQPTLPSAKAAEAPREEKPMPKSKFRTGNQPRPLTAVETSEIKKAISDGKSDGWIALKHHIGPKRVRVMRAEMKGGSSAKNAPATQPAKRPPVPKEKRAVPPMPVKDGPEDLVRVFLLKLETALGGEISEIEIKRTNDPQHPIKMRLLAKVETWVEVD